MQDVFVAFLREEGVFERLRPAREAAFRPLLYGVVRNMARRIEQARARKLDSPRSESFDADGNPSSEEPLSHAFDRADRALRAAFGARDPSQAPARFEARDERRGYETLGEIARGGMGVVFKALDLDLTREVALKVLRAELAHEPRLVLRLLEEAWITRQVEPRNTPSVINAVFNSRNFWDGRAQNVSNGVNGLGERDPSARVFRAAPGAAPVAVAVRLEDSSLASQAVAPVASSMEMSADGRAFPDLGAKLLGGAREFWFPLAGLRPLGLQRVHPQDSALDHPQLFVPDGHLGDDRYVPSILGLALDRLVEVPAVGRQGGAPLRKFLDE